MLVAGASSPGSMLGTGSTLLEGGVGDGGAEALTRPPWVSAQLYLRHRRRRPEQTSPLLLKRLPPPGGTAQQQAAVIASPSQPITTVRALTASTSAPALLLDDEADPHDDAEGENLVRQVSLVRQAANRRVALGRSMMLPPPCDDVFLKLPLEMQPDVDELVKRMRQDKTNHRTTMARMLLCQPPPGSRGSHPPPLQHLVDAKRDEASNIAMFALSEDAATRRELDVFAWIEMIERIQVAQRSPRSASSRGAPTAMEQAAQGIDGKLLHTPLRPRRTSSVSRQQMEEALLDERRKMDSEQFWRYLETRHLMDNVNTGSASPGRAGSAASARAASPGGQLRREQTLHRSPSSISGLFHGDSWAEEPTDPRWIAAAMLCFPLVVHLSLSDLPISKNGLALTPCWRHLRTLRLSTCPTLVSEDLVALSGCVSLEVLTVSHCPELETLMHLEGLPKLRRIDARNCLSFGREALPSPTRSATSSPTKGKRSPPGSNLLEGVVSQWLSETDPNKKLQLHTLSVATKVAKAIISKKGIVKSVTLVALPTLREIDLAGCDGVRVLKVRLPAVEALDLSWLPSLSKIEGRLAGLLRLDISHCNSIGLLPASFFKMCPLLEELTARGCEMLTHIRGLRGARALRRLRLGRCSSLHSLENSDGGFDELVSGGAPESMPGALVEECPPHLQYLDIDGCLALPKKNLRDFIAKRLRGWAKENSVLGESEDCAGYRLLRAEATADGAMLEAGERCETIDFWKADGATAQFRANFHSVQSGGGDDDHDSNSASSCRGEAAGEDGEANSDRLPGYTYRLQSRVTGECLEIPSGMDGDIFEAEPPDEAEDALNKGLLVVWPSREYAKEFLEMLLEEPNEAEVKGLQIQMRMAARMKLCEAIRIGRQVNTATEDGLMASEGWRHRAQEELIDALRLIDQVDIGRRVEDFPLLRAGLELARPLQVADQVPPGVREKGRRERILRTVNLIIPMIGSGPALMVSRASQRVAGATAAAYSRPIRARIDVGVDLENTDAFDIAVERVKNAARAWCPRSLRSAWEAFEEVAEKKAVVGLATAVQERQKILEGKFRFVSPVLKRGFVEVNFNECKISTARPLKFAPRAPPDTTAEFAPQLEVECKETLKDLAVILEAFLQPMVVEGRTGGSDPYDYWLELANNRSRLIISVLEGQCGLPVGLLVPAGEPGGGAQVLVYPFDQEEMERRRLSQRHRPKPRVEASPESAKDKDKKKKGK